MSADVFTTEVSRRHEQMIEELESIDIDSLKSEGLRLTLGGKTFKFTDMEVVDDGDVEERIRSEFKEKLNTQQQKIREKINTKINQLLVMHQQKQQELDRKEEQMKRKYSETAMMPEIDESHMVKGLSVVKGNSNNELLWIFRAIYNPRFLIYYPENSYSNENKTKKPLPSRLVNRMRKDMLILIKTKDKRVLSVVTRKIQSGNGRRLSPFPHYHQQTTSDCWGSWRHSKEWETPNDIIRIAKEAEAILETINHGSLAENNPTGLPRISTLLGACEKIEAVQPDTVEREGGNDIEDDVWQSL